MTTTLVVVGDVGRNLGFARTLTACILHSSPDLDCPTNTGCVDLVTGCSKVFISLIYGTRKARAGVRIVMEQPITKSMRTILVGQSRS